MRYHKEERKQKTPSTEERRCRWPSVRVIRVVECPIAMCTECWILGQGYFEPAVDVHPALRLCALSFFTPSILYEPSPWVLGAIYKRCENFPDRWIFFQQRGSKVTRFGNLVGWYY
ncbi:hypothetical protein U1Q18_051481 [Sarracenia purpurea var. burkii]